MKETIPNKETLDRLLELGANLAHVKNLPAEDGHVPFGIIPSGCKAEDLSKFFPLQRIVQSVKLLEAGSFIDYVNRYKTGDTLIFSAISETGVEFTALMDYHTAAPALCPGYCSHRATFVAIETPEWKVWKAANRLAMTQVGFATFLEDNLSLFVQPTGAELLEMVRSLHGHRNARFNTALRLDNGSYSVSYDEDVVVKGSSITSNGELELPPTITAMLAVFQGSDPYAVQARLKSRCEDRKLVLFYETISLAKIIRESILLLVEQVAEKTGIVPLLGSPS